MSTVTVDGLAVEISSVAAKNASSINEMAKAVKTLRNAFGGTTWKSAEENMNTASKAVAVLKKSIDTIDVNKLNSLASVLNGMKAFKLRLDDAGSIEKLESKVKSLQSKLDGLTKKRSSTWTTGFDVDKAMGIGSETELTKSYRAYEEQVEKQNKEWQAKIASAQATGGSPKWTTAFDIDEQIKNSEKSMSDFTRALKDSLQVEDEASIRVVQLSRSYAELSEESERIAKEMDAINQGEFSIKGRSANEIDEEFKNTMRQFTDQVDQPQVPEGEADDASEPILDLCEKFDGLNEKISESTKKVSSLKKAIDSIGKTAGIDNLSSRLDALAAPQGSSQYSSAISSIREYNESSMQLMETMRGFSINKAESGGLASAIFGTATAVRKLAKDVISFPTDMIRGIGDGIKNMASAAAKIPSDILGGFKEITNIPANAINSLWKGMQKYAESIPSRALKAFKSLLNKTVSGLKSLAKSAVNAGKKLLSAFSGQFISNLKSAYSTLTKWTHSLGRIAVYRAMRTAIKEVTSALKEGINNMYEWASLNDNVFKSSMDSMATDALYIKNSFASAVAPLVNALVPIVTRLAEAFSTACNAAARFFAIITGQSTYNAAKRSITEYDNGISDATESAEDLKNTLLGIDELNVLPDSSSGSSGSDSSLDYSDMFEETSVGDVPDWLSNIVDLFKSGDWDRAAKQLANQLNNIIRDWDAKAWAKKLGAKIQKGLHSALEFLRQFDFSEVGSKVANILEGLMEEISPTDLGAMLAQKFTIILDLLHGFVYDIQAWEQTNEQGLTVGSYLAEMVNGWFDEIDWENAGRTIRHGLEWVINTVFDFIDGIDGDSIVTDMKDFFNALDLASVWATFKERLFNTLGVESWEEIGTKINEVITDKIVPWVTDEFGEIDFGTIWETLKTTLCNALGVEDFGDLLTKIKDTLGPVIKDGISDAIDWVKENFSFWEILSAALFVTGDGKGKIAAIILAMLTGDSSSDEEYKTAGNNASNKVKEGMQETADESDVKFGVDTKETGGTVMSEFKSAAQTEANSSNLTVTVDLVANTSSLDSTLSSYSGTTIKTSASTTRKTTKMAKGGIVSSATLFGGNTLVGEAGREAVVPLENNTGWLDGVADRIINAMNNQSQQEVVSVSMDGEVFYQQMVKKNRQNRVRTGVNAFA